MDNIAKELYSTESLESKKDWIRKVSFDLNLSPKDTDLLCANCKRIEIEYVNNKD